MPAKLVAVDKDLHKNLKVKTSATFEHASTQHLCLVQIHEFIAASAEYPLVFVKDPDNGEFRSVAMMGLVPGENLFYSETKWQATYVPNSIQINPWGLAPTIEDPQQLALCIDIESDMVGEAEGAALYDDKGEQTPYLKNISEFVGTLHQQAPVSITFVKYMAETNLLHPQTLSVTTGDEEKPLKIDGIYTVNTKALEEMSDEDFLELRKRNYLPVMYAHLASLGQVGKLARWKAIADKT